MPIEEIPIANTDKEVDRIEEQQKELPNSISDAGKSQEYTDYNQLPALLEHNDEVQKGKLHTFKRGEKYNYDLTRTLISQTHDKIKNKDYNDSTSFASYLSFSSFLKKMFKHNIKKNKYKVNKPSFVESDELSIL